MRSVLLTAMILSQTLMPALAASEWKIDSKHSAANFSVKHMMVSNVRGSFGGVTGKANYDAKKLKDLAVDAEIDVKTVNTNEPGRDEHLRGADFFNSEKFPKMTFKSKKVLTAKKGNFKLLGDLTMHGVTKEVTLDVEGPTPIINEKGVEHTGATATAIINRKDFGIEYNKILEAGGVAVGDDVKVTLDIELVKNNQKTAETK